jgi:hypothetical protein
MIVNDTHKQAVKATIARRVVAGDHPSLVSLGVSEAAWEMGLQLGDFNAPSMERYARAVERNSEMVSNRRWASYPAEVASLSQKLERKMEQEINALLQ